LFHWNLSTNCFRIWSAEKQTSENIKVPWTPKLTYHFPKRAQFSENFDSNIGNQRFVNTKKLTFEIDDLRKQRRKQDAVLTG